MYKYGVKPTSTNSIPNKMLNICKILLLHTAIKHSEYTFWQFIDSGCACDLVLVVHLESEHFIENLWGMSAVLDSAVKVVWQAERRREYNRA